MDNRPPSPASCQCCSPCITVSEDRSQEHAQEQACCDSACLEVAAQLECDAQCSDGAAAGEATVGAVDEPLKDDVATAAETGCCASKTREPADCCSGAADKPPDCCSSTANEPSDCCCSKANELSGCCSSTVKEPSGCCSSTVNEPSGCCSGAANEPSGAGKTPGKKPCKEHLKAARDRYSATLEAFGCICKALLARNLESCCSTIRKRTKRSSGCPGLRTKTSGSSFRSAKSAASCSKDTCCSGIERKEKTGAGGSKTASRGKKPGCCGGASNTCGAKTDACKKSSPAPGACGQTSCCDEKGDACMEITPCDASESCSGDACCAKESDSCMEITPCDASESGSLDSCCGDRGCQDKSVHPDSTPGSGPSDVEKNPVIIDHVTLSVEGLTCVGCENKLFRSLNAIPGIRHLQTSLVMARAEFDIDAGAGSVSDIIREVTKATGFTCERVHTRGQSLDVLVPGDARDFVNQPLPRGVEGMVALDKQTVRVTYDAGAIGARDLLEKTFDAAVTLGPLRPHGELEAGGKHVRKMAYITAFSAVLTIPVLVLAWAPLPRHEILYGAISMALATIVQVAVAGPFYPSAFRALLFTRVIEMDLLIVLSTSAAYIFSVIAFAYEVRGHPLSTGEFFETSTLLVTLIMLGRLVSAFARQKAIESISIRSLQIGTALLVDGDGLGSKEIDARLLQYGDVFKVLPDSRIATDGVVVSGESEVDESSVTGEAVPVEKSAGSNIIAGCLNGSGTLIVRLTRLPGENTISEIATMVDAAKFSKPKVQQLADRVASYFVPVVIILTLITFFIWIAVGKAVRHQSIGSAAVQAMTYAISVLIVSCPCAIGLAVPMVVVIAGGVGAKHGVVFKSAETIEIARKVSHVVFDKTGTLTQGTLSVSAEEYLTESRSSAASVVLGLTINSKHPVSAAVAAHLQAQGVQPASVEEVKSVTGSGMEGVWDGRSVRGGNSRWLAAQTVPQVAALLSLGRTVFCVSLGEDLVAVYGLDDSLRPDSQSVVSELQSRGIAVSLVSGDDDGAVQRVGLQLGIPDLHIRSRCSPGDKQKYIKAIMEHKDDRVVLFCGDGTNDAVALAQANIGLHMSSGTDVAQSAADAVLVRPALSGVLVLIDLSQAAFRRIVFNFSWSFVYNTFAVLLAAGAFVHARIPPEYAGLGELVSVLPVILIALQLRWFKRG